MCGPHFCSMKITQDVREFAAAEGIAEEKALEEGLERKAEEFRARGRRDLPEALANRARSGAGVRGGDGH